MGKGHVEVVRMMRDNLAVRWAAQNGHCDVLKLLLNDVRVDPAVADNWAIFSAASKGYCDVVELLLSDERVDGTRAIPEAHSRAVLRTSALEFR